MKFKSILPQLLLFFTLIAGSFQGIVSPDAYAWIGIASAAATIILQKIFPSGMFPTGWDTISWVTNGIAVALQLINLFGEQGILKPEVVVLMLAIFNSFTIFLVRNYKNTAITEAPPSPTLN